MANSDPLFNKLSAKFDEDVFELLRVEKTPSKLSVLRHHSRPIVSNLILTASLQGDIQVQVKIITYFANQFLSIDEITLAKEAFEVVEQKAKSLPSKVLAACNQVDAIQGKVLCDYNMISASDPYTAPMVVSKLLRCLVQLRSSLDILFDFFICFVSKVF